MDAQLHHHLLSALKIFLIMFWTIGILHHRNGFWTIRQTYRGTIFGTTVEWTILKTLPNMETINLSTSLLWKQCIFLGSITQLFGLQDRQWLTFGRILKVIFIHGQLLTNLDMSTIMDYGLIMIGKWCFEYRLQLQWMGMLVKLLQLNFMSQIHGLYNILLVGICGSSSTMFIKDICFLNECNQTNDLYLNLSFMLQITLCFNWIITLLMWLGSFLQLQVIMFGIQQCFQQANELNKVRFV